MNSQKSESSGCVSLVFFTTCFFILWCLLYFLLIQNVGSLLNGKNFVGIVANQTLTFKMDTNFHPSAWNGHQDVYITNTPNPIYDCIKYHRTTLYTDDSTPPVYFIEIQCPLITSSIIARLPMPSESS